MNTVPTRPRLRKAVGPERPTYLRAVDTDSIMAIMLALVSEVSALRDRLDTHERLADAGIVATSDQVERFQGSDAIDADREAWRRDYIDRLFRVVTEEIDAPAPTRPD